MAGACERCGEPGGERRCARCAAAPPSYGHARACFLYRDDDLSSELVARWKYGGDHVLGSTLASLLCEHRSAHAECYDVVVPVPLHVSRLAQRGFNQAALLARAVARRGERVAVDALRRATATAPQAALGRRARAANVRDVFTVGRAAGVTGRSVLLVDDVVTTGATVQACSTILLDSGAKSVGVWSLARTPRHIAAGSAPPSPAVTAPSRVLP